MDSDKLQGQKCYLPSSKLLKSVVINCTRETIKETATLEKSLSDRNVSFKNAYANEHTGLCLCTEYNTKFEGLSRMKHEDFMRITMLERALPELRKNFIEEKRGVKNGRNRFNKRGVCD